MPTASDRGESLLEQLVRDNSVLQYDEPAGIVDKCRYCGCTEDDACDLGGVGCAWYRQPNHRGLGVCSNPECVKAYLADAGAP
jgi:hypothetical protein